MSCVQNCPASASRCARHAPPIPTDPGPPSPLLATGSEDQDELVVADMDLEKIEEVRRVWQFFRDRRPESYGAITAQES